MDKFVVKWQQLNSHREEHLSGNTKNDLLRLSVSAKVSSQISSSSGAVSRHQALYLCYGFIYIISENHELAVCFACSRKLSNESMVPNKLKQHSKTKHSYSVHKTYFNHLLSSKVKQVKVMEKIMTTAEKSISSEL